MRLAALHPLGLSEGEGMGIRRTRHRKEYGQWRLPEQSGCDLLAANLHLPAQNKDTAMAEPLDEFISAAAAALDLPLEPEWHAAIKANLAVTLKHANFVADFALPDEAEPAPVYKA
jgi:1-carboxybiuret hydrolase subunit AtzG-like